MVHHQTITLNFDILSFKNKYTWIICVYIFFYSHTQKHTQMHTDIHKYV